MKERDCMKKKKWLIPIAIIGIIIVLWFTGIIPKQIAKISGTNYVNKHFPEMQLECVGVEYADVYGDYLITFKGTSNRKLMNELCFVSSIVIKDRRV